MDNDYHDKDSLELTPASNSEHANVSDADLNIDF